MLVAEYQICWWPILEVYCGVTPLYGNLFTAIIANNYQVAAQEVWV
jgi:hypothetical protein